MFLKIPGGIARLLLPLIAGSASKTCQHHLETRDANVWDLIQTDQLNLATQTGEFGRPVCRTVAIRGPVVPRPPFEIGAPISRLAPGCCIHPILYF